MDLLIRLFPLQMSRPTCVLCFYLIGGLVAISFIVPDLMAQNYPDSQVWEKLKITIYLVSSSNEKITKIYIYNRDHSTSRSNSRGSSLCVMNQRLKVTCQEDLAIAQCFPDKYANHFIKGLLLELSLEML